MPSIAIDGPSGVGKSTLAKMLADKLGYVYLDTGAIYRTITLYIIKGNIDIADTDTIKLALPHINFEIKYICNVQYMFLNGIDVSQDIRSMEVSQNVSAVSAIPAVRDLLLGTQRKIALENNIIMDGRDIGTVVLPNADIKIFLTASDTERANRRYNEYLEKGLTADFNSVLENIRQRDKYDSSRKQSPLKPADDAIIIDTTNFTLEESFKYLTALIKENLNRE